eukprot:CAMPEP_0170529458 /NCGR_PEP_ID=MMETSP0209-20121228/23474_1 /TAXON_ID=665100 ORGANISM="Litonotus pictus, Strain P1" /NCGR_SAMPLE_ID=MMETSP0209 /ASSEMBLY_ACC=CAM_ASM_000301 /LENGTH=180 /DNA_ID=CAMNT_0010821441 /DNA_START=100 /DNA_END=642 /DNA_ORIENTATION=+
MNLVLADTEEFTRFKSKKEEGPDKERKRALGLIILRGENIVSFSAEAPPSNNTDLFGDVKKEGEGKSAPISRGMNEVNPMMGVNQSRGMGNTNMNMVMGRGVMPMNMPNMPMNNLPNNMNNGMNPNMNVPNLPMIPNMAPNMMRPGMPPMMGMNVPMMNPNNMPPNPGNNIPNNNNQSGQ